jgi:hypothetical protein
MDFLQEAKEVGEKVGVLRDDTGTPEFAMVMANLMLSIAGFCSSTGGGEMAAAFARMAQALDDSPDQYTAQLRNVEDLTLAPSLVDLVRNALTLALVAGYDFRAIWNAQQALMMHGTPIPPSLFERAIPKKLILPT